MASKYCKMRGSFEIFVILVIIGNVLADDKFLYQKFPVDFEWGISGFESLQPGKRIKNINLINS